MLRSLAAWRAALRTGRRRAGIALLVVGVEIALRIKVPLPVLAGRLGVPLSAGAHERDLVERLPRWAQLEWVEAHRMLAAWPFGDTCLRRCLVAGHRMRGLSPVLVLGVTRRGGRLAAHSWLEIDGRVLDPRARDYERLQPG